MSAMQSFWTWFFNQIPNFLMSEPIIYLVAIAILALLIQIVVRLLNISKGGRS